MSENLSFNQKLDLATDITDCAVALLDLQDPLEQAIDRTYKAAVDHADALRRDGQADTRALLIAYGGLRAMVDQLDRHTRNLGRLLDDPAAAAQPTLAAK